MQVFIVFHSDALDSIRWFAENCYGKQKAWKPILVTVIPLNGIGIAFSFFGLNLYASSSGRLDSYQMDEIVIL